MSLGSGSLQANRSLGETLDGAAVRTHQMRMQGVGGAARGWKLIAPHVIRKLGANQESGLHQGEEIPVDGHPVQSVLR